MASVSAETANSRRTELDGTREHSAFTPDAFFSLCLHGTNSETLEVRHSQAQCPEPGRDARDHRPRAPSRRSCARAPHSTITDDICCGWSKRGNHGGRHAQPNKAPNSSIGHTRWAAHGSEGAAVSGKNVDSLRTGIVRACLPKKLPMANPKLSLIFWRRYRGLQPGEVQRVCRYGVEKSHPCELPHVIIQAIVCNTKKNTGNTQTVFDKCPHARREWDQYT